MNTVEALSREEKRAIQTTERWYDVECPNCEGTHPLVCTHCKEEICSDHPSGDKWRSPCATGQGVTCQRCIQVE